jgi:uncharacterized protein
MKLVNATRNKTLTDDLKEASSFWDRLFGLIDKRNPRSLLFKTRFGLHTFFLDQPIDLLVLNTKDVVVYQKSDLSPYRFFFYNPIHSQVVELPSGTLKATGTTINDKIFFE